MNIKPQYFALAIILFIGGFVGVLFFGENTIALFSRSVTPVADIDEQGVEPRPLTESLDNGSSIQDAAMDIEANITALQRELVNTVDNPEKALELRRRIQSLREMQQQRIVPTTLQENS